MPLIRCCLLKQHFKPSTQFHRCHEADNGSHHLFRHFNWFIIIRSISNNQNISARYYWEGDISTKTSFKMFVWKLRARQPVDTQGSHCLSCYWSCVQVWRYQVSGRVPFGHLNCTIMKCMRMTSMRRCSTAEEAVRVLNKSKCEKKNYLAKVS